MYGRYQKALVRVESDARLRPESQNFDGEVYHQGDMVDSPDSHVAMGDDRVGHPPHNHHCPLWVGNLVAVAGEKVHSFERPKTLSGGVESKERADVMVDVIAKGCGPLHLPVHQFRILLRNFHRDLACHRSAAAN